MGCNLKMFESILALIVIIFTYLNEMTYSRWIVIIAGLVLLWHALTCKKHNKR